MILFSAITRQDAVNHIGTGLTFVSEICKNVSKGNSYHAQEMTQIIYLSLLEMPEQKIMHLINNNQIKYYIVGMITNQLKSQTSDFYRKYKRNEQSEVEFESWHSSSYEFDYDRYEQMDIINQFLIEKNKESTFRMPNGNSYEVELFEMYYKDNLSYGQMAIKTGIPKPSCFKTVSNLKNELKEYIQTNYPETLL